MHTEIKHWATERGVRPALSYVLTHGAEGKLGRELVFVFSDSISESSTLQFLEWGEFFRIFDQKGLYFIYDSIEEKSDYYSFEKLEDLDQETSSNRQQRTINMVYK